jgi:hypothetical protein
MGDSFKLLYGSMNKHKIQKIIMKRRSILISNLDKQYQLIDGLIRKEPVIFYKKSWQTNNEGQRVARNVPTKIKYWFWTSYDGLHFSVW